MFIFSSTYIPFWLITLVLVLHYCVKGIAHHYGYETHLFRSHWNDVKNLNTIIKLERDPEKRIWLQVLRVALYGGYILIFPAAIALMVLHF